MECSLSVHWVCLLSVHQVATRQTFAGHSAGTSRSLGRHTRWTLAEHFVGLVVYTLGNSAACLLTNLCRPLLCRYDLHPESAQNWWNGMVFVKLYNKTHLIHGETRPILNFHLGRNYIHVFAFIPHNIYKSHPHLNVQITFGAVSICIQLQTLKWKTYKYDTIYVDQR